MISQKIETVHSQIAPKREEKGSSLNKTVSAFYLLWLYFRTQKIKKSNKHRTHNDCLRHSYSGTITLNQFQIP